MGALVFVGLAPLASGLWRILDINREALVTSMQEYQLLLASSTAEKVDLAVEGLSTELVRIAQTVGADLQGDPSAQRDRVRADLERVLDDRIAYVRYSPLSASESISVGVVPDALAELFEERIGIANALTETFPDAADHVLVSRPLVKDKPVHASGLVLSYPVTVANKRRGDLFVLVDWDSIWSGLTDRQQGAHVVYVLDYTGTVFATTDCDRVRQGEERQGSVLASRFLSGEGRARETMPFKELRGTTEFEFLGSYETTQLGWGVFVRAELNKAYVAQSLVVKSTLASVALVLVLAAVGAGFFAMSLSKPVARLAFASRAFARGEFQTRVTVRSRNEIGELAHTFNSMATKIEEHIEKLERAAIENSELFEGTIRALAEAIDAKDPYTRGHSVRVHRYSVMLARELRLPEADVHAVHVASLLHDIGKIGIDDAVLTKPGKLTPAEYEKIKSHAALGAGILAPIPRMKNVLPGLRWHHERLDGSGYPDGLSGDRIPMVARIIAVADTFDAVTSNRSYQRTKTFPEGIELLNSLRGALDPVLVCAFDRLHQRGQIRSEEGEQLPDVLALAEL
jgi:putative nucleotidyltransferase with HDIG domain